MWLPGHAHATTRRTDMDATRRGALSLTRAAIVPSALLRRGLCSVAWRRLLCLLVLLPVLIVAPRAVAADLRLTFDELTRLLQSIASGTKIYLNNAPGILANTSYAQVTTTQVIPIPIPATTFEFQGSTYGYFINDVTSSAVRMTAQSGFLRLTLNFESEGPEVIAKCQAGSCAFEDVLPDIEWNDAVVHIDFVPITFNGSISLEVKKVTVAGTPKAVCKLSADFFEKIGCGAVTIGYANRKIAWLKGQLPLILAEMLNGSVVRQQFADGLKRYLTIGQAGEVAINNISIDPKTLTVRFQFNTAGAK